MNSFTRAFFVIATCWICCSNLVSEGRPFSVADDIAVSHFGDPYRAKVEAVTPSPDGTSFVVVTERGRLDLNKTESTLWVYRSEGVREWLSKNDSEVIAPYWRFSRSNFGFGSNVTHIQWLPDSSGFAFLDKTPRGNDQLVLADLNSQTLRTLSLPDQQVQAFDIQDPKHVVYAALNPEILKQGEHQDISDVVVGTGRIFDSLIIPPTHYSFILSSDLYDQSEIWTIVDDKPFRVDDPLGTAIHVYKNTWNQALSLSPDGYQAIIVLPLQRVPEAWQREFPPPPGLPNEIKASNQDLTSFGGTLYVGQYGLLDLRTGEAKPLIDAPTGYSNWWFAIPRSHFSKDGRFVVVSDSYLPLNPGLGNHRQNNPCITEVELASGKCRCVKQLAASILRGQPYYVLDANFVGGDSNRIDITYLSPHSDIQRTYLTYSRLSDGSWVEKTAEFEGLAKFGGFQLSIREDLNTPPTLVATSTSTSLSKTLLDPNPQLKDVALASVTLLKWKDAEGHEWKGGLYTPRNLKKGVRAPFVFQTHGFIEGNFAPEGPAPSGFAAQELAEAGIMVLQADETPFEGTKEMPSSIAETDSAILQLTKMGLIDPNEVGIIGWSRTVSQVLAELTFGKRHIRAAEISDGVTLGYMDFLQTVDYFGDTDGGERSSMIGARPFGPGLQTWLRRSPDFNMDKVTTPVLAVGYGRRAVPEMWEPYAALRYLHKPVDLIILNTDEHTILNPAMRLAAQGTAVDWFRFWLQNYEDPNPSKANQYVRWRELRKMQQRN